jgi:hypothetical protein
MSLVMKKIEGPANRSYKVREVVIYLGFICYYNLFDFLLLTDFVYVA